MAAAALVVSASSCSSARRSTTSAADKLVDQGLSAGKAGNSSLALQDFQAAIKSNPLETAAYYDIGVIYQQQHDTVNAEAYYQKALLVDPKYQSAMWNLALLETPTSPASAVALYEQLNTFDHNDPNVLLNLGLLLRRTGNVAQGNSDILEAVRLNPALAPHAGSTNTTPKTTAPAATTTSTT